MYGVIFCIQSTLYFAIPGEYLEMTCFIHENRTKINGKISEGMSKIKGVLDEFWPECEREAAVNEKWRGKSCVSFPISNRKSSKVWEKSFFNSLLDP